VNSHNHPVITGVSLISGLGIGTALNWDKMVQGISGIRAVTRFDTSQLLTKIAAELPADFEAMVEQRIKKMTIKRTASFTQLALLGTQLALEDAGIDFDKEDRTRVGVILGNCMSAIAYMEEYSRGFAEEFRGKTVKVDDSMKLYAIQKMESLTGLKIMQNAMTAQIAIDHKIFGPNMVISTACAASGMATEIAANYIRQGELDIVITGGAEIFVTEMSIMGFNKLAAISTRNDEPAKAIKPFDKNRDGTVLGDGAGILILESEEHARKRGAQIYARHLGSASVCEGYSLATPEPDGKKMGLVMTRALQKAEVRPDQIDYISAHGTGTLQNDSAETAGIKQAFGEAARNIPISSQKSMVGHTIGAAGGIELVVTALSMKHGIITPTINYETPDPKCDLFYVPNQAIEKKIHYAISNTFALGGHNNCTVLEKVE
jgi:3-oxoacyl-[acyl-carrier-protein] synthase II